VGEQYPGFDNVEYATSINLPLVHDTRLRLDAAGIDYAIFSGSHAALLGGHRVTPDVDFWTDHEKWEELIAAFSSPDDVITDRRATWREGQPYDGVLVTRGNQGDVGIMAGTIIFADGVTYPSPFTELVRANRQYTTLGPIVGWFANPADTLLFKAISQRGRDQGKHDIDDITAITSKVSIDRSYLLLRMDECRARERTLPLFLRMGVLTEADVTAYDAQRDIILHHYLTR